MTKLVGLLSPSNSADMHTVVAELIKGIISMAAPSPAAGLSGADNGPASNQFARELARRDSVATLVGYILSEPPQPTISTPAPTKEPKDGEEGPEQPPDTSDSVNLTIQELPNADSTASSIVQSICIIIELIRQNNSDYFEPYLFHTLRNRLIHVQQQLQMHTQDGREALERAMKEMVHRMGVVHLGPVLDIMCDKLEELQKFLLKPRSIVSSSVPHFVHCSALRRALLILRGTQSSFLLIARTCFDYRRSPHPSHLRTVSTMRALCRVTALLQHGVTQSFS